MPTQAGGGTRFAKAGSLWKTSWRGRVPFSQAFCISGFTNAVGGNFYEDAAVLPGSTGTGFFIGAVVGIEAVPVGADTIARSGDVATEGWTLDMLAGGIGTSVQFRFTVFDGAGIAAQVLSPNIFLNNVGDGLGPDAVFVSILAGLSTVGNDPPNGRAFIIVPDLVAGVQGDNTEQVLGAPYVNSTPHLLVGVGTGGVPFSAPNCIQGLVGGTAPWVNGNQAIPIFDAWNLANQDTDSSPTQIQPVADATVPIGIVNTNGWRSPVVSGLSGPSPDPLPPFVGAVDLTYGLDPAFPLTIRNHSPVVFYPGNVTYPFPPP